jgi:hypothetical protein
MSDQMLTDELGLEIKDLAVFAASHLAGERR